MINYYQSGNTPFISSEKISFKSIAVTALCCSSLLPLSGIPLSKENKTDELYSINSISDISHSSQDYFSSYAKDYNSLLMRIDEIQSLKENWNGYGADVVPFNIINNAKIFLFYIKDLSEFISIFPTARQSIQIEFEVEDMYCEAEIFSDIVHIYSEKNDNEFKNKEFNSVELASSDFRNIFNARTSH